MKQINVGHWRIAFIAMAIIMLSATLITPSIPALAFLVMIVGLYLGFELFIVFQIVFAISQWIAHTEQEKATARAKETFEKSLRKEPIVGSKG